MLTHRHRSHAKPARDVSRRLRPSGLELEQDAFLGARIVLHDNQMVPAANY
jgi:hypothetical protein